MNTTTETTTGAASLRHEVDPAPEHLAAESATLRRPAEPTRLHLLWLLTHEPRSVTGLTRATGAPRTVVSQHLAKLRLSGMVVTHRAGRHVIYSLPDGHLIRLIREMFNHADHRITGEPVHALGRSGAEPPPGCPARQVPTSRDPQDAVELLRSSWEIARAQLRVIVQERGAHQPLRDALGPFRTLRPGPPRMLWCY